MRRLALLVVLVFALAVRASSDSYAPVQLDSLFKYSDFVGVVDIIYGSIRPGSGTVYKATVIERLKGVYMDSTIYFGPYARYRVGGRYLVFLSLSDSLRISRKDNQLVPRLPGSDSLTSFFSIMFLGFGIMPIEYVYFDPDPPGSAPWGHNDDAVEVATTHVILPGDFKSFPAGRPTQPFSFDSMWKIRWVRYETMLLYLRQLSKRMG